MLFANAKIQTDLGQKYIRHLCRHFNHKVEAVFNDTEGRVQFDQGFCVMQKEANQLAFYCRAETDENMRIIKYILDDHLKRFARTEQLEYSWQEGVGAAIEDKMTIVEESQL